MGVCRCERANAVAKEPTLLRNSQYAAWKNLLDENMKESIGECIGLVSVWQRVLQCVMQSVLQSVLQCVAQCTNLLDENMKKSIGGCVGIVQKRIRWFFCLRVLLRKSQRRNSPYTTCCVCYGVTTVSRFLKIIGLFCRISSLL